MKTVLRVGTGMAVVLGLAILWQAPSVADEGILDLGQVPPATSVEDAARPDRFDARVAAAIKRNAQIPIYPEPAGPLGAFNDYAVLARLAYLDYVNFFANDFADLQEAERHGQALRDEAIRTLNNERVRDLVGSTIDHTYAGVYILRRGEYDVNLMTYIATFYKYFVRRNVLPADVADHVLYLLNNRGPYTGEYLSIVPISFIPIVVPESENHVMMIYAARYLTNQLLFSRTHDPQYDNGSNGMIPWMLGHLREFLVRDFIEYNSRDYQNYTMSALLNLYSYAEDARVKDAARMVLDYISAKIAVSSNDTRRHVPYRRLVKKYSPQLIEAAACDCPNPDPQAAYYMMLSGVTDMARANRTLPGGYAGGFQWAGLSEYRIPPLIHDLFVNRSHRHWYQRFRYCSQGSPASRFECNNEIYFSSPSYLISAGGNPTDYAYVVDLPDPFPGEGNADDKGLSVATTLMPTKQYTSTDQLIRFERGPIQLGVAPNFACGINPVIPPNYLDNGSCVAKIGDDIQLGKWTFINRAGGCSQNAPYGYYVAVFEKGGGIFEGDFGCFEVFDTHADATLSFGDFQAGVLRRNPGAPDYSLSGINRYITTSGQRIDFSFGGGVAVQILSVDGVSPGPNTSGSIINSDGNGLVTIDNPCVGTRLVLDMRNPAAPARYEVAIGAPDVWVDFNFSGVPELGTFASPFNTLGEGVLHSNPCGSVNIKPGHRNERIVIGKALTIKAPLGTAVIGE